MTSATIESLRDAVAESKSELSRIRAGLENSRSGRETAAIYAAIDDAVCTYNDLLIALKGAELAAEDEAEDD